MTSSCWSCIYAKGKNDGLGMGAGSEPGDCVFCTNVEYLREIDLEVCNDPEYGYGCLIFKVEVIEGEAATCEAGIEA